MINLTEIFRPVFSRKKSACLALVLFISATQLAQANSLSASVDRDRIDIQESLTLVIDADAQTSDEPDLDALRNDFDILNTSKSRNITVVNGHTESRVEWQISLAPKRTGQLLIPSFTLNRAVSDAIVITVSKQQNNSANNSDEQVRLSLTLDKNESFVQEQLLLTVRVISQVNLGQTELQTLSIPNAVVSLLDEKPKRYITTMNGRQHLIEEQHFAIFPQTSGVLTIPSLQYSVVPQAERNAWNDPFGRSRPSVLRLTSEPQIINIKPAPKLTLGKSWQPANQLSINETWSASLDHLKVGEPVTRTITISGDGITAGQIAPIENPVIEGLIFYPDQPQTAESKSEKGIQATRIETSAIIANHGGDFTLPATNITWWDNTAQAFKTASLPEKHLTVLGAAKLPTPSTPIADTNNEKIISAPVTTTVTTNSPILWITNLVFIMTTLALLGYCLWLRKKIKAAEKIRQDMQAMVAQNEKKIWEQLKNAAHGKDAAGLRKAIFEWAHFHWPEAVLRTLEDVSKQAKNAELTEQLKTLDALLYSNHVQESWDPIALLQQLHLIRKDAKSHLDDDFLKPLYAN